MNLLYAMGDIKYYASTNVVNDTKSSCKYHSNVSIYSAIIKLLICMYTHFVTVQDTNHYNFGVCTSYLKICNFACRCCLHVVEILL